MAGFLDSDKERHVEQGDDTAWAQFFDYALKDEPAPLEVTTKKYANMTGR